MLGSLEKCIATCSLSSPAIVGPAGYDPAVTTAFGESLDPNAFFTGKPRVDGFGFRNYRPELGKWQTADPLGYPDGWNRLAYCENGVIENLDLYGCHQWNLQPGFEPVVGSGSGYWVQISAQCNEDYYNLAITYTHGAASGSASTIIAPYEGTYDGRHVRDSEAKYFNFSYRIENEREHIESVGVRKKRITLTFDLIILYSVEFYYQYEVINPDTGVSETHTGHAVEAMTLNRPIKFQCEHQVE